MPSDSEVIDPLLRAITDLRSELNHLIDEQVASVKERWEEPLSLRTPRSTPVPVVTEAPEEVAKPRALDPKQRLDALAKHLDHRLRQANAPGPERADRPPATEG